MWNTIVIVFSSLLFLNILRFLFCAFFQEEIFLEVHIPTHSIPRTMNHGDFQTLVY